VEDKQNPAENNQAHKTSTDESETETQGFNLSDELLKLDRFMDGLVLATKEKLEEFLAIMPMAIPTSMNYEKVRFRFKIPMYLKVLEDGTVIDERGELS
jgi:hypothetical protein